MKTESKIQVFDRLRVEQRVRDKGYGDGKVTKVNKTSAYILLSGSTVPIRYDRAHVNMFIRTESK